MLAVLNRLRLCSFRSPAYKAIFLTKKIATFKVGDTVTFEWDGFVEDKYDSSMLVHREQEFKITGIYNHNLSTNHSKKVKFEYKQEEWADVKINKKTSVLM